MALLDKCSWAHSDPTQVVQGQIFSFAVAVPPLVPSGALGGTVLDTATAATVVWRVTDTATKNLLVLGDDYQIVAGGLNQMNLAFVVNPTRVDQFSVQPVLSVAGGGPLVVSNAPPVPASWLPVDYTPFAASLSPAALQTDLQTKAQKLLQAALQLTASADLVEPGASVTLKVVERALTSTPQVVTNLVHELPDIKIRGAIPLGALVEAIIGPTVGAVSSALPSSTDSVSGPVGDVANLLAEALAIPIAIDVGGRKVTRTLAPLTTDLVTTVTSEPGDAQNLAGTIPIDGFLTDFQLGSFPPNLLPEEKVNFKVTDKNHMPIKTSMNLSPGLKGVQTLVQTLLLLPDVVALGPPTDVLAPVPVYVNVSRWFDLPNLKVNGVKVTGVKVDLPQVTLLRLPLVLPQIAAVFQNAFEDWNGSDDPTPKPQMALLSTDSIGVKLMPSLDSEVRLLSTLASVLDTFAKAFFEVGIDVSTDTEWNNLLDLGQGVRLLVTLLGRLRQTQISFQPAYDIGFGIDRTFLRFVWDDAVSAVIHIGALYDPNTISARFLRLRRTEPASADYIDFNGPDASNRSFISIISNLVGDPDQTFNTVPQVPPSSAVSSDDTLNFDNSLDAIEFRRSL